MIRAARTSGPRSPEAEARPGPSSPWRRPEAAAILASIVARPPPLRVRRDEYGWREIHAATPDDRRVAELRRLFEAEWERMLVRYDRGEVGRAEVAAFARDDEQAAIARALEAAALGRAA